MCRAPRAAGVVEKVVLCARKSSPRIDTSLARSRAYHSLVETVGDVRDQSERTHESSGRAPQTRRRAAASPPKVLDHFVDVFQICGRQTPVSDSCRNVGCCLLPARFTSQFDFRIKHAPDAQRVSIRFATVIAAPSSSSRRPALSDCLSLLTCVSPCSSPQTDARRRRSAARPRECARQTRSSCSGAAALS